MTARDRCPELETGLKTLTALSLEISDLEKARETLEAVGASRNLRELCLRSGCADCEVGKLVRETLLVNSSLQRLTLDLRDCSDDGAAHLAEVNDFSYNSFSF